MASEPITRTVCFNPPTGEWQHDVTSEDVRSLVLDSGDGFWCRGSFDAAIAYYDGPVAEGSYPWASLHSRLLLLPGESSADRLAVIYEPREGRHQYLAFASRSAEVMSVCPCGEPWSLYGEYLVPRAELGPVVEAFCFDGQRPAAPDGYAWIPEPDARFPPGPEG